MDPVTLGVATLAASTIGQGANMYAQAKMNRKTREWNEKMYGVQRRDAISDWEMQNKYNHPMQQMQRLKEAGLNPNLVYGKGADNIAGVVKSPDVKGWQPNAPQMDAGSIPQALSQFVNFEQRQVQTDNTRAATEVAKQQAQLLEANKLKVLKDTDYTAFKMLRDKTLLDYQVDAAAEGLRNKRADTSYKLGQNERSWQVHELMKMPNYNMKLAELVNIKARTANTSFEQKVLEAQSEKLRTETNLLRLTGPQQVELNKLLSEEKTLNNILIGEKTATEEFERRLKAAQFTSDQIKNILNLTIPKRTRVIHTRK